MAKKEVHNAIVTRNTDNDLGDKIRGAVFFNAPSLFDGEYPIPAEPSFPFASAKGAGFFVVPKVGDEIEVEIQVDDGRGTDDVENPEPRWRCMVYSNAADIDAIFKTNYPFRMGWKSNSGHYLLFDDKDSEEMLQIFHKKGTNFLIDKDGSWLEKIVKNKVIEIVENLTVTIKKDVSETIDGKHEEIVKGLFSVTADGAITLNTKAALDALSDAVATFKGKGGTNIGDTAGATDIKGSAVSINAPTTEINSTTIKAGGSTPVARLGDQCIGTGNLGAPVVSQIIQGSPILGAG